MMRMTDMLVDKSCVDDKPIADISNIVLVATQGFELKDNDDPTPFTDAVKLLDSAGQTLVLVAIRMMRHKDIAMATSNQATIERCQKLAQHFSASIKEDFSKPNPRELEMRTLIFFPPPSTELKLLLEDVKNTATRSFLAEGEVSSRFVLVFEDDRRLTVPCSWSDDEQKRQMLGSLKQTIREHGRLVRSAHVAEVWASEDKDVRPSKSKNRTEHLMVRAEERSALPIGGWFDIKRHALSPMPTLGSWVDANGEITRSPLFDLFDDDDQSSDGANAATTTKKGPASKTSKPVMPLFVFEHAATSNRRLGLFLLAN